MHGTGSSPDPPHRCQSHNQDVQLRSQFASGQWTRLASGARAPGVDGSWFCLEPPWAGAWQRALRSQQPEGHQPQGQLGPTRVLEAEQPLQRGCDCGMESLQVPAGILRTQQCSTFPTKITQCCWCMQSPQTACT